MTHITPSGAQKISEPGDEVDAHPHTGATPTLEHRFTIRAEVDAPITIAQRHAEPLEFIPITGGPVTGELTGEIVSGGGDWCLVRADGAYNVEARYGIRTQAGAYVDVINTGVLRHLPGESGTPAQMGYFMTTPSFRTADPNLQWLTRSLFLGQARTDGTATTIEIFEVMAGISS